MSQNPISVVVERKALPGKEQELEQYIQEIIGACSQFPGYLGTDVFSPEPGAKSKHRVVFRFDSMENLKVWEHSPERLKWVDKIDSVIESPTELNILSGLETWFVLPKCKTITPPPKYKMAVVVWCAITPLLIVFNLLLNPILSHFSMVPRIIISTPFVVLIMTYLLMPFMTKLFKKWLYPQGLE